MQPRARCRGDWLFELSNKLPMKKDVTREGVVVAIDDDNSVRAALKELLESVGLKVRLYELFGARCEVARNEWPQSSRGTEES